MITLLIEKDPIVGWYHIPFTFTQNLLVVLKNHFFYQQQHVILPIFKKLFLELIAGHLK